MDKRNNLMSVTQKLAISRALAGGVPGKDVLNQILSNKDLQKQGETFYPGEQFGIPQNEVKAMLQNGIKTVGFSVAMGANATYTFPNVTLTGLANIMLGFGLSFPDQNGNFNLYPVTFNFKVNNQTIVEDVHPMSYDIVGLEQDYFEYVYLLSGKDKFQVNGQNGGTAQTVNLLIYYI